MACPYLLRSWQFPFAVMRVKCTQRDSTIHCKNYNDKTRIGIGGKLLFPKENNEICTRAIGSPCCQSDNNKVVLKMRFGSPSVVSEADNNEKD